MRNIRQEIDRQLRDITIQLMKRNFCIYQKWPKFRHKERIIVWEGFKNIAFLLKDEPYNVIYKKIVLEEDFNFLLLDHGVIQMLYKFDNNDNIIGHILSFYPQPIFIKYQDFPKHYEELIYGDELFGDIQVGKIISFPLRFDFSETHNECIHPRVHLTLGNFQSCRIPVSKPLSPKRFISFILRNFYFDKFIETDIERCLKDDLIFKETITPLEKQLLHFHYL